MKTYLATECIKFGWETFKKRPWFLIGMTVLYFVVSLLIGFVGDVIGGVAGAVDGDFASNAVSSIASFFLGSFLGIMMVAFLLKAHDDPEHVQLTDAWKLSPYWYYIGAYILMGLAFVGGLILLIIPGIIFGLMFCFASYLAVDRGLSPIKAMKESARMTKGHKWELFLLAVASLGLIFIGLICLLVGFLVAMPVVSLAFVHAYRLLQQKAIAMPAPATVV